MGSKSYSFGISEQLTNILPELENVGTFASPESVVTDPGSLGAKITGSGNQIHQSIEGNVGIQGDDLYMILDSLAGSILEDSQNKVDAITEFSEQVVEQATAAEQQLAGVIEGIKTPLAKYLPFVVVAAIVLIIIKWGK